MSDQSVAIVAIAAIANVVVVAIVFNRTGRIEWTGNGFRLHLKDHEREPRKSLSGEDDRHR